VQNFGEPFLLVIHEGETLAEVKKRIQKKLQVQDEEFAKVLLFFLSPLNEKYGIKYSLLVSIDNGSNYLYPAFPLLIPSIRNILFLYK
jgi:Ubiquitin-specific protease C-terminal